MELVGKCVARANIILAAEKVFNTAFALRQVLFVTSSWKDKPIKANNIYILDVIYFMGPKGVPDDNSFPCICTIIALG